MNSELTPEEKQPDQQGGAGRIIREGREDQGVKGIRDISFIDMQEGDMNNGELGGNFVESIQSYGPAAHSG